MYQATGTCQFCHQTQIVLMRDENYTQPEADEEATEKCKCEGATLRRKQRLNKELAEANIDSILVNHAQAADFLKQAIPAIQSYSILSVTAQINDVSKVKLSMNQKGSFKVEKIDTLKQTLENE